MKFCTKCGKEIDETVNFCPECGADTQNSINEVANSSIGGDMNVSKPKQKNFKKIFLPIIGVVLVIAIGVVSIIAFGSKKYEKVAESYMDSLLMLDIAKMHETTLFNEEAYDIALVQDNEKVSNVSEMYSYLSNEYFFWSDETDNYADFYAAYTLNQQANYNSLEADIEITEISSVEMTEEELNEICSEIAYYEFTYNAEYVLPDNAWIDGEKITEGYNVSVTVFMNEKESTYDLILVNYDGEWYVVDNMCLKACMGDTFSNVPIFKGKLSDDVLKKAFSSINYSAGWFTITYEEVLKKCAPNCEYKFLTYEEGKEEQLTQSQISYFEDTYSSEELENAYFAIVTGKILHNPEIPNYYTSDKEITNLLLFYDEEGNLTAYCEVNTCDEFGICASILCVG